ncbi:UNVERIFIED_CONTAM: hypothetical protein PYX00_010284 [Menopon gallinae]|uniref:Uncharacterized protein n=1 Tax=Menopon gallinae TaxID=328185 RepID=A0AAW2HET0_9NEOP
MTRIIHIILFTSCLIGSAWSDDPTCEKVGPICNAEKTKIMFCPSKGADPIEVESCGEGESCIENKDKVVCEKPAEKELRFECSGPGEFPDPKDCSKTYICKSKEGKPSEVCNCVTDHNVYPTEGLFCVPGNCPRKDITCEEGKQGHFELLTGGKTSFYYYCKSADVVTVYGGVETLVNRLFNFFMLRGMTNGKNCVPYEDPTTKPNPEPTNKPNTEPTNKPNPEPTNKPNPEPTNKPNPEPTNKPNPEPTTKPNPEPTNKPNPEPTTKPNPEPTNKPNPEPTNKPNPEPTNKPNPEPTTKPNPEPTNKPNPEPTTKPNPEPTNKPNPEPTNKPNPEPTNKPNPEPTNKPNPEPTNKPNPEPTNKPNPNPTSEPNPEPTTRPTPRPPVCNKDQEIHAAECDCDYYRCNKLLVPVRKACLNGLRFSAKVKTCVIGQCDESKCLIRPPKP